MSGPNLAKIPNAALRQKLAAWANDLGRGPKISADSKARELAEWLQWCDPNGAHLCTLDEVDPEAPPHTLATAWYLIYTFHREE